MGNGQDEQRVLWESILHALLSGVLDYLDNNATTEAKDALGDALIPVLGDLCFSLSAPKTSVDLRCTAYNILIDSAASHQENQRTLREAKVLGGERLGSCIWRTRDYLALESLLNLFARALPSTRGSASGRTRRTAFIHSVFLQTAPPESAVVAKEITDLLERVSSSDWDETSLQIVDALARSSIYYPQPFGVHEVVVGGKIYPSDRLYADVKTFLVNVVLEREDQYESLEILYTTILTIRLTRSSMGRLHIILSLTSPPRLGKDLMKIKKDSATAFSLMVDDESRFLQALKSRGLAPLVSTESLMTHKLSLATEPARLELDSTGRFVKEPTQDERVKNLSQLYRTDEPSDDIVSAGDSDDFAINPTIENTLLRKPAHPPVHADEAGEKSAEGDHSSSLTKRPSGNSPQALVSPDSRKVLEAAFGTSDDDLSEFTDEDSPLPKSRILKRTNMMTSLPGRISFEPASVTVPARLARGGVSKLVLGSDDEAPPALPLKQAWNARKTLRRVLTTDTIPAENPSAPAEPDVITSNVSSPVSEKIGRVLVSSTGSECVAGTGKVLRFSDVDIPPPDFNAPLSSPPVVPKSALKSALVIKLPMSRIPASEDVLLDSPCTVAAASRSTRSAMSVVAKATDVLDDLIPASSSPTPGAKKSVKAGLRKKQQLVVVSAPVKAVKRKAIPESSDDDAPLVPRDKETASTARPAKRARTRSGSGSGFGPVKSTALVSKPTHRDMSETSTKKRSDDSPALRRPMQARKRYHARRARTSSPSQDAVDKLGSTSGPTVPTGSVMKGTAVDIDYDELPAGPPQHSVPPAAAGTSCSPALSVRKVSAKKATMAKNVAAIVKHARLEELETKVDVKTPETNNVEKMNDLSDSVKDGQEMKTHMTTRARNAARPEGADKRAKAKKVQPSAKAGGAPASMHKSDDVAVVDQNLKPNAGKEEAETGVIPRVLPWPRRAAKGAMKVQEVERPPLKAPKEDAESASAAAHSSDLVPVTDPLCARAADLHTHQGSEGVMEITKTRMNQDYTDVPAAPVAEDLLASDPSNLPFLDDIQPSQPEMVFSDLSTAEVSGQIIHSSSAQATKLRSTKPKVAEMPWDTVAQRIPYSHVDALLASEHNATKHALVSILDKTPMHGLPPWPPVEKCNTIVSAAPQSNVNTIAEKIDGVMGSTTTVAASPTIQVKQEQEVIDLTFDSPPKTAAKIVKSEAAPVHRPHEGIGVSRVVTTGNALFCAGKGERLVPNPFQHLPQPAQRSRAVRFTSPTQLPSGSARREHDYVKKQQETLTSATRGARGARVLTKDFNEGDETLVDINTGVGDPGLEAIVTVRSIANKFEGVRHEARVGRDELLRYAAADLQALRIQSITHFNRLVDLEVGYATIGRNMIHRTEDLMRSNQQACVALTAAIEKHDRGMLPNQMPATLITLKL
ncbi:hypothetical protein BD311DRAFT_806382 [Dichomitus squalens]|uniref:Uncharacterized protein n=1 Tax=Dichomitus squalens TaxID=114155 RepID=A0A4Q9MN91_9APHY|nr:hypothetical protein BD311DRAFT_806382 [Dichomitus squalens]